ncbi:MAG: biotin--[acetyl-CoA-carboxylase] ligase [Chitinophagaceae bacterium]|nr:biotin--[acetyl-CoA-carboxylase] ligase [Chitinophagaceae bacterium]MCB0739485.1 biotin--[acetyl-CoA-carboxylase] ligase [Chitinophagaceae bacterium]
MDSTNNYARQQIHAEMAQSGMTVFAHEQVAGKGQRGKSWTSEKDVNMAISVILKPELITLSKPFQLSVCVAVAAFRFFEKYAGEGTKIKWPNDIYWQDRKAGGILIENTISASGNWDWAVCGIGININQANFPSHLRNPVSLKQITGKNFDIIHLAKELCQQLDMACHEFSNNGFEQLIENYNSNLYKRNEKVKLKKENRVFEAEIKTVLPSGELLVQHTIEESFSFGEVEWILMY